MLHRFVLERWSRDTNKSIAGTGSQSESTEVSMSRKWDQSILHVVATHPYELIGAQLRTLFMLLKREIGHNHAGSRRAQACSATAYVAYSILKFHFFVTRGQIWKKVCVKVDFTLLSTILSNPK